MNKAEFIESVAELAGSSKKDARLYVDAVCDAIEAAVQQHQGVDLTGVLKIEIREVPAREYHNPFDNSKVHVEDSYRVHVRPMSRLKAAVK